MRFALDYKSCYDPQCKHVNDFYPSNTNGCKMSFWRKEKHKEGNFLDKMGEGWNPCYLLNANYKWGFSLPDKFKGGNHDFVVSIHDCHKRDVELDWGIDPISGKKI